MLGPTEQCGNFTSLPFLLRFKCTLSWTSTPLCTPVLCLVTQSCLILSDPMDCSPPGSSVHRDSPGKNTGVGCHALLQGIFPTQGSNPGLSYSSWILSCLNYEGRPLSTPGTSWMEDSSPRWSQLDMMETWKLKFLFSFLPWHLTFWTIIAGFSYLCSLPEQELTTRQTKYYLYLYS